MSEDTYTYARMYAARGWKLVALHWVTAAGQCSCGRPGCKAAGKHPINGAWTTRDEEVRRWMFGHVGELNNIGIRTGRASGFWVLDFDPNDADDAGRAMFDRLMLGGSDVRYPAHVRTGGGGFHWRFQLPDFEVRNRQSAGGGGGRTHGLPMGWDVRGEGGQVVAPPSVSGKGAYVELHDGVHEAPAWLLDMIRPVERVTGDPPGHTVPPAHPTEVSGGSGGSPVGPTVGSGGGSSHRADRVQAYANAAMIAECEEYASLHDGRRGEAAAAFARRLVELANLASWSTAEGGPVYAWFEGAMNTAARNGGGGGYAPHEIGGQWARALEHVGDRPAVMPPGPDVLPAFAEPFLVAGAAAPAGHGTANGGAAHAGVNGAVMPTATTPGPEGSPDPWARAIAREVWQRDVREAAERFRRDRETGDVGARLAAMRAELIDAKALKARPRLRPIVDGVLYRNTLARINGASGDGKSLIVLDLAAAVAAGRTWAGRPTHAGTVVYLVAEGEEGVGGRVEAWEGHHRREFPPGVLFLPRPVQVMGEEWPVLTATLAEIGPALVIGDTQARMTSGVNEIDNTELGEVVERLDGLRVATGAAVLLVHHYGTRGDRGRGGTAITGALQTELGVKRTGTVIEVSNPKNKDAAEMKPALFDLVSVPLADEYGIVEPGRTGAVAVYRGDSMGEETAEMKLDAGQRRARALWNLIAEEFNPGDGGTRADFRSHFYDVPEIAKMQPDSRKKAWQRAWATLIGLGLVAKHFRSARFKVVELVDQSAAGVLTANPDAGTGGVGRLNGNWELWTNDLEESDPEK